MKCVIRWIDNNGKSTPDDHDAVMLAHFHEPKWTLSAGGVGNKMCGYSEVIRDSFPICAEHYSRVTADMRYPRGGWTFTPIDKHDRTNRGHSRMVRSGASYFNDRSHDKGG